MSTGRLLNEQQAAEYLGFTAGQLRGLRERRQIPVVKIGRSVKYDTRQLDRWIEAHTIPARAS